MRPNKLRDLLKAGKPSIGTRVHSTWPSIVEAIGHTGLFDYVEFLAEYAPFDLYSLDNFCRAAELFDMTAIIKVDQEPRGFLAQRGIGAGFQGVLFADCRSVDDVEQCVRIVRPETPEDGGTHGVGARRFAYMGDAGSAEYVQALRDVVVMIMIEKQAAVERLEEILSVKGIDMVQWGPADYSMSIGRAGERNSPEVKDVERRVFETALKMGVPPRAEITNVDQAKYYLDLGVRHFNIGADLSILFSWWKTNGDELKKALQGAS
jgi:4-hydroxy-2-oxoheptanedioate aldolase